MAFGGSGPRLASRRLEALEVLVGGAAGWWCCWLVARRAIGE